MSAFIIIRCDDMNEAKALSRVLSKVLSYSDAYVIGDNESIQGAVDYIAENMDKVIVLEKVEDE